MWLDVKRVNGSIRTGAFGFLELDAEALPVDGHPVHPIDGILRRNRIVVIHEPKPFRSAWVRVQDSGVEDRDGGSRIRVEGLGPQRRDGICSHA